MQKIIYLAILFAICSLSFNDIHAQVETNGYIISATGDTIRGQILLKSGKRKYKEVSFVQSNTVANYTAKQIQGYHINGVTFQPEPGTDLFWEVLVLGEISLYKRNDAYVLMDAQGAKTAIDDKAKTEMLNGQVVRTGVLPWRGTLAKISADCISDNRELQQLKYRSEDLIKFVAKHNDCKGSKSVISKSLEPKAKLHVGPAAKYYSVNSTVTPNGELETSGATATGSTVMLGISGDLFIKNTNERITLNGEILISKYDVLLSEVWNRAGGLTIFTDFFLESVRLTIPLTLQYSLSRKYPKPYVMMGGVYDKGLTHDLTINRQRDQNGIVTTDQSIEQNIDGFFGLQFGAGCKFKIGKHYGTIEAGYHYVDLLNDGTRGIEVNHDRIGGGVKFFF